VWELVEEEKRSGRAVLLTTHYMEEAEKLSDYIYLIYKGSIVAEGSSEDLKKRYAPESVVEIELYKDISRAVEILREEGFKSFVENDIVKIFSENPREDVPKIITILYSKDVYVKSLKVAEPTLEDVFIKLTGRRLSEE
jgi:ABC-2 type transport system ATP-binding protein